MWKFPCLLTGMLSGRNPVPGPAAAGREYANKSPNTTPQIKKSQSGLLSTFRLDSAFIYIFFFHKRSNCCFISETNKTDNLSLRNKVIYSSWKKQINLTQLFIFNIVACQIGRQRPALPASGLSVIPCKQAGRTTSGLYGQSGCGAMPRPSPPGAGRPRRDCFSKAQPLLGQSRPFTFQKQAFRQAKAALLKRQSCPFGKPFPTFCDMAGHRFPTNDGQTPCLPSRRQGTKAVFHKQHACRVRPSSAFRRRTRPLFQSDNLWDCQAPRHRP